MKKIIFSLLFIILIFQNVYAEESVFISRSISMENITLDGKWTTKTEWKESVHKIISFDGKNTVHLRTAHHENFIYFLLDFISDTNPESGLDRAMICLNQDNDRNSVTDLDDFCFNVVLNENSSQVMNGQYNETSAENFKEIENKFSFMGIGTISDSNDRYSQIPHSSYEFKIPTNLVGRSSTYGFYFSLYDNSQNKLFSWPSSSTAKDFSIPNPNTWGTLVSPDKSLPEFNLPLIVFGIIITSIILIQLKTKYSKIYYKT